MESYEESRVLIWQAEVKSDKKRAVVIGATSGLGKEVALLLASQGWYVGIAGRRESLLADLKEIMPERIQYEKLDVTKEDAPKRLYTLVEKLGGMDLFFLSAGIGSQNTKLEAAIEEGTVRTNVEGFTRMTGAAFRYFREQVSGGHIAVISSIAGTKGLGVAPAYSATKCYQNTYMEALSQLAHMQHLPICFTDIRPGFVATDLLGNVRYPMLMTPQRVAKHIVKALSKKKRVAVIDFRYAIITYLWHLIPRGLWERMPIRQRRNA